jgi:type I restriction enzyme R subunit
MPTDTSEKGLESIIFGYLTGEDGLAVKTGQVAESPLSYGIGYFAGCPKDFSRDYALDLCQLFAFLRTTQPEALARLGDPDFADSKDSKRNKFLTRLSNEVRKRGVIDVLRRGVDDGPVHLELYYSSPSDGNRKALELNAMNRFSVTRQLAYSVDEIKRALDLCIFVNGLSLATFELKNRLTKQNVYDAIAQYRRDRDPREKLFEFGRCAVHFAVDDSEIAMCTELQGASSWFLPFNKGYLDGAGNPPNPDGIKTDYLWKDVLTLWSLTDIIEHYAQIVEEKDRKARKTKRKQIWPRYHQLDAVRELLADVGRRGIGRRYLIQHSAGSGKSNSIAWLAHQLVGLKHNGTTLFDSVIVVTDRRILDDQLKRDIKSFMQVGSTVGHADHSGDLRKFIESGKKIIVSTVQKFPFIIDEIESESGHRFAIVIDEAHSSQGGKNTAAMGVALGDDADRDSEIDPEDRVNAILEERMASRKLLANASYFAFTATPKAKTLELFGEALPPDAEGKVRHKPFHVYTMKQAIEEHFIIDILKSYTPVNSYYKLVKKIEDDPEFDVKKANKKLRKYVESNDHAIKLKAEIMVDHFQDQVYRPGLIGGQARAMVVTSGIERAIQYYKEIEAYLVERGHPYRPIVAFSGEYDFRGSKVTEASLNGFPSSEIADRFKEEPFRFLICADKFQTGYDEPLLQTMYVDKILSGIKAVQTLSRLNRAHPLKKDCFILDFQNDLESITFAFQDYYRTTLLAEETDPNKLHDLKAQLDAAGVYDREIIEKFVTAFLMDAPREELDPVLDACAARYKEVLDEDQQVEFKGSAKAFCRSYDFLAAILPYRNAAWEELSIFLNLLVPKLPAPREEDLSRGILEAIDMDSYRVDKQKTISIALEDENSAIAPIPVEPGKRKPDVVIDRLSNILAAFNEQFGANFEDGDRVFRRIREEIAPTVAHDPDYLDAKENTPQNARMALDQALSRVMRVFLKDDMATYKLFVENGSFQRFVSDMVYALAEDS